MPADCVRLGIFSLMDQKPDVVFSGVNCGPNLGTDTLYSGTVGAAMEGCINHIPSVAVSIQSYFPKNYETAAAYALVVADWLERNALPDGTMLNVNVPDLPKEELCGVSYKPLGYCRYSTDYVRSKNPRGELYFWHPEKLTSEKQELIQADCDIEWCEQGHIVVTPLKWDRTHAEFMEKLSQDGAMQWKDRIETKDKG